MKLVTSLTRNLKQNSYWKSSEFHSSRLLEFIIIEKAFLFIFFKLSYQKNTRNSVKNRCVEIYQVTYKLNPFDGAPLYQLYLVFLSGNYFSKTRPAKNIPLKNRDPLKIIIAHPPT